MWERNVVGVAYVEQDRETRKVILSFAQSIQERDVVTYEHSRRVATYVQRLARYLGWSRREARDLALAALVHDLGKTWIANDILNKSGALSEEERRTMERHPVIGARILIGCDVHPFYVETVLHHHEKWNGQGYPAGQQGEDIPIGSRIIGVVDAFDAMTSDRPYRRALTAERAAEILRDGGGRQWDPTLVDAFLRSIGQTPAEGESVLLIDTLPAGVGAHRTVTA